MLKTRSVYPTLRRASHRQAFTLLEIVLAVSVGLVLVIALYSALYVQFHHGKLAREIIDESSVVRSILAKITNDISPVADRRSAAPVSAALGYRGSTGVPPHRWIPGRD